MKKLILGIMVFSVLLVSGNASPLSVSGQQPHSLNRQEQIEFIENEILIQFREGTPQAVIDDLVTQLGGPLLEKFAYLNIYHVKINNGLTVPQAVDMAQARQEVLFAEPNYIYTAAEVFPGDPQLSEQWALHNTGQQGGTPDADIDAPEAWQIKNSAPQIIVAVIDSGCHLRHEDLAGNLWVNPGESGIDANGSDKGTNGIDDDGNGFIDDVNGANFIDGTGNPEDDNGHGTGVAGIIGAVGDNDTGVTGVAWDIQLMCLKLLDTNGVGNAAEAVKAIKYAKDHGASSINASWTGGPSLSLHMAIRDFGKVFVAAAGNSSSLFAEAPAAFSLENVMSVAATDNNDNLAPSSNRGDLKAPGVSNLTTGLENTYVSASGASIAAAHTAGVAGLVRGQFPQLTEAEVNECLRQSADQDSSLNSFLGGAGRLNAHQALQCIDLPVEERGFTRISHQGFKGLDASNPALGSTSNSYMWSMAEFKGDLYVGTFRDFFCLLVLFRGSSLEGRDLQCPETVDDLDLRAEIWRYDFETGTWKRVFQSPEVITETPGGPQQLARDIGYRAMVVHTNPDGQEALYVANTSGIPGSGVILETTDGENFINIFNPESIPVAVEGFRGLLSYQGKLYATPVGGEDLNTSNIRVVLELVDSSTGMWRPVNEDAFGDPNNVSLFELAVAHGFLYVGTGNSTGFQLWRTDGTPDPDNPELYLWERVLTEGAGAGTDNLVIVSMKEFKGHLYLGGGFQQPAFLAPELLRVDSEGNFDIICGDARETSQGLKTPLSGLGRGCGNPFTGYIWRMVVHQDQLGNELLYVGTFDAVHVVRGIVEREGISILFSDSLLPMDDLPTLDAVPGNLPGGSQAPSNIPPTNNALPGVSQEVLVDLALNLLEVNEAGFDVWITENGANLVRLTNDGFGNHLNYGARTLAAIPEQGVFVGTANPYTNAAGHKWFTGGGQIWQQKAQPNLDVPQPMNQFIRLTAPSTDASPTGTDFTVTVTVPMEGIPVAVEVLFGPNAGTSAVVTTDANGVATFTYTGGPVEGTDIIQARIGLEALPKYLQVQSNIVERRWATRGCLLGSKAGRIVVEFPEDVVLTTRSQANNAFGPMSVNIPSGTYRITLVSFDEHIEHPNEEDQIQESWFLRAQSGEGEIVFESKPISDLAKDQNLFLEQVEGQVQISKDISGLSAKHALGVDESETAESVRPVCAAFDRVS